MKVMNKRLLIFTLFITCVYTTSLFAQDRLGVYAAAFYNLENLWDTVDDPNNKGDDDFTPEGKYEWTQTKYEQKLQNIAKVISQLGRDYCPAGPAIIGISEVENRKVLEDLTKTAPISGTGYEIVHFESPDHRGIDVAALYNPKLFKLIDARTYPFNKPDMPHYKTRDILLVSGILAGEPFHLIVNHWPSRYGGSASSPLREFAASIVKHIGDSIHAQNPEAKVLIVGDLNDDPMDESLQVLGARKDREQVGEQEFYNPWWKTLEDDGIGTLCYRGKWNLFDQIVLTRPLLEGQGGLLYDGNEVFRPDYLFQHDDKYEGYPLRTHGGRKWLNGYSDHLPTIVYLRKH